LLVHLERLPGNERAYIGFLGFDSALHFFHFDDPESEPKHIIEFDIEGGPERPHTPSHNLFQKASLRSVRVSSSSSTSSKRFV
jgi:hypothetical protein